MNKNLIMWDSEFIVDNDLGPCMICGRPTNLVDIFVEGRICSEACCRQIYHEIAEYERTHPLTTDF